MQITRAGTQPSGKGPAEWFTGVVRIDPLFTASGIAMATMLLPLVAGLGSVFFVSTLVVLGATLVAVRLLRTPAADLAAGVPS